MRIGPTGFEPAISCPPDRRDNQASLRPDPVDIRDLARFHLPGFGRAPPRVPIRLEPLGSSPLRGRASIARSLFTAQSVRHVKTSCRVSTRGSDRFRSRNIRPRFLQEPAITSAVMLPGKLASTLQRRPLAAREKAWARKLASVLASRDVTPNAISLASVAFALAAAAALWVSGSASASFRNWLLLV